MSFLYSRAYPENAPIAELCTAELFAVSAMRLWVEVRRDGGRDDRPWRNGFAAAGMSGHAAGSFHTLLLVIMSACRGSLDIRHPRSPQLGADEACFLHLIGLLQRSCMESAELVLTEWLEPSGARTALPFAFGLAAAMAERDLKIPRRPDDAALRHRFGQIETRAAQNCVLALVH